MAIYALCPIDHDGLFAAFFAVLVFLPLAALFFFGEAAATGILSWLQRIGKISGAPNLNQ